MVVYRTPRHNSLRVHAIMSEDEDDACCCYFRWTPRPVIVTIMDNRDYIRVLLYFYYTTITGWGVLLTAIILSNHSCLLPADVMFHYR